MSGTKGRHQRDDTGATAEEQGRMRAVPDEPPAGRPADLYLVAWLDDIVEVRRDLAVVEALDGEVDLR